MKQKSIKWTCPLCQKLFYPRGKGGHLYSLHGIRTEMELPKIQEGNEIKLLSATPEQVIKTETITRVPGHLLSTSVLPVLPHNTDIPVLEYRTPVTPVEPVPDLTKLKIILNKEKKGIELYFSKKPEREIIYLIKENGFRWSHRFRIWWAPDYPDKREFADRLKIMIDNGQVVAKENEPYKEKTVTISRVEYEPERKEPEHEFFKKSETAELPPEHEIKIISPYGQVLKDISKSKIEIKNDRNQCFNTLTRRSADELKRRIDKAGIKTYYYNVGKSLFCFLTPADKILAKTLL